MIIPTQLDNVSFAFSDTELAFINHEGGLRQDMFPEMEITEIIFAKVY
jgi:hypothetical protein